MRKLTQSFLFLLVALLCCVWINVNAETLTVGRGSATNQYLPIYGLYVDTKDTHGQVIYLADSLTEVAGGEISKLTFYLSTPASAAWSGATFQVSLGETTSSSLGSGFISSDLTVVYTGSLDPTQSTMDVEFATPFSYEGGNLVVDFLVTVAGTYKSATFAGASVSNAGRYRYTSESSASFIPKVTFEYSAGSTSACVKPANLSLNSITADEASFKWEGGENVFQWQYLLKSKGEILADEDWENAEWADDTEAVIPGLEPISEYVFYVRSYCGDEDISRPVSIAFKTLCAPIMSMPQVWNFENAVANALPDCWGRYPASGSRPSVYDNNVNAHSGSKSFYFYGGSMQNPQMAIFPEMEGIELNTLQLSLWYKHNSADASYGDLEVGYIDEADSTFHSIALLPKTTSYDSVAILLSEVPSDAFRLALRYAGGTSSYGSLYVDDIELQFAPVCPNLASLSISNIERRSLVATISTIYQSAQKDFEIVCSAAEMSDIELEAADKLSLNDTNAIRISGLERETLYHIYARAVCGGEHSEWITAQATTLGLEVCGDEVVIGNGSSDDYGPICGYYGYERNGYIFTPEDGLVAGKIAALAWQYSSGATIETKIYIKNTNATTFETSLVWNELIADAELVFDNSIALKTGWNTINFSTLFNYTGGNIMVLVASNAGGSGGKSAKAYYTQVSGATNHFYIRKDTSIDDDTTLSSFSTKGVDGKRHNIKFVTCHTAEACPAITDLSYELIGSGIDEAVLRWNIADADYLSGFDVILSESEIADFEGLEPTFANIQVDSIDLKNLSASTHYYAYVRAICQAEGHDEGNSTWVGVDFETLADCPAVVNLYAGLIDKNKAEVMWNLAFEGQEKHFQYVLSTEELDDAALEAASHIAVDDTTYIQLADLAYEQEYHLYVASVCGSAHSAYSHISFTTLPVCQAVDSLLATRVEHNRVELTWESPEFATAEQWEVGIVGDEALAQIVRDRHAILFGLNAETPYQAYVKAICSETESSAIAVVDFTTAAQPGDCILMGTGTSTAKYPFTNYNYAYSQTIYPASELQSGNILSLRLQRSSGTAQLDNVKIYLGTTDKSSFAVGSSSSYSSDWVAEDDLTLVYDGSIDAAESAVGEDVIILDAPFAYNGQSNLVLAVSHKIGVYGNIHSYYYTSVSNTFLSRSNDNDDSYANYPSTQGSLSSSRANIQFCFEPKACPDVTALAVSEITTSSAKISWEPMGAEMAWNVFISSSVVQDFSDLSAYNVIRAESLGFVFDELNDDTDYFVYVQPADCEGADFSMISFRTVASCLVMQSPAVVADSIAAHTARVTWIDPNETPAGQYTVAYAKYDDFDLNGENILTVQVTDTFADLSALQADTVYRFAVMANCGGDDPSLYSVEAQFTTLQSCFVPNTPSVQAESITAHEALVYWTDSHDDAGYIVAYGPYDTYDVTKPETYLTINVTDTFALLQNLLPATRYRVQVKGDCSAVGEGQSRGWSYSTNVTTACEAMNMPYAENFESSEALLCWTVGNRQSTSSSYIPYRTMDAKANGNYGLYLYAYKYISSYSSSYNTYADSAYAVLPDMDFGVDGIAGYTLRFNAKSASTTSSYYSYYKHILVGVADDDALTNLTIVADSTLTGQFAEVEVSFENYVGSGSRIVLMAIIDPASTASSLYGQIYVDDIVISHIASCKRVASLNDPTDVTESQATFSWVAGGDEVDFQYVVASGSQEPDWTNAVDVIGANSVTVQGLSASTSYVFYVRANCGDGEENKSEARSISFRTECGAIELPFFETFENGIECWKLMDCDNGTGISTEQMQDGEKSFKFRYNTNPPQYLISPEFIATSQNVEVAFYYRKGSDSWTETFNVGYSTTTNDIDAFTWSDEITANNAWEIYIDTLAVGVKYVAIRYTANDQLSMFIDSFSAKEVSVTPGPATAIDETIMKGENVHKLIIRDHLFIIRDGKWYDAMGQKVEAQR